MPACCSRNRATHSALPQVRPEPRRRLPHGQAGGRRASHAAYASSSAVPPLPGTETTGRMRPPGRASHSRGPSAAGLPGMGPIAQSSLLRNPPDPFPRGAGERLHDLAVAAGICSADHAPDRVGDRAAARGPGQRCLAGADLKIFREYGESLPGVAACSGRTMVACQQLPDQPGRASKRAALTGSGRGVISRRCGRGACGRRRCLAGVSGRWMWSPSWGCRRRRRRGGTGPGRSTAAPGWLGPGGRGGGASWTMVSLRRWRRRCWRGRVAEVIERVSGVRYSQAQTWVILRERLGWSRQRPARRAVERNEEAIAAWVKQDWPRIKKAPGAAAPG